MTYDNPPSQLRNKWLAVPNYVPLVKGLLADGMSWITRRVEDIFPNQEGERRKVSLDLDMDRLRSIAGAAGWARNTIPIPLGWMKKGLTPNFSVRLDGESVSVWDRDDDSMLGAAAIVASIPGQYCEPRKLPKMVLQSLYHVCWNMATNDDFYHIDQGLEGYPPLWKSLSKDALEELGTLTANDTFRRQLLLLTMNYMPVIDVPRRLDETLGRSPLVKFEIMTTRWLVQATKPSPAARVDLTSVARINVSGDMEARREHLHIHVPDGMEVSAQPLAVTANGEAAAGSETTMLGLVGHSSVALYRWAGDVPAKKTGDFSIIVSFWPQLDAWAGRTMFGLVASAAMLVLLVVAALWGRGSSGIFTHAVAAETYLFAFLQIVPSVMSGLGMANGDQPLRQLPIKPIGRMINAAVSAGIVAAVTTAVAVPGSAQHRGQILRLSSLCVPLIVWSLALVIVSAAIIWLGRSVWLARHYRKTLDTDFVGRTQPLKWYP